MGRNKSDITKRELLDHLLSVVQELPVEQIAEVSDFAQELQANAAKPRPERGSIDALLHTLNNSGPLQFESDELEKLLDEISALRELDLDKDG